VAIGNFHQWRSRRHLNKTKSVIHSFLFFWHSMAFSERSERMPFVAILCHGILTECKNRKFCPQFRNYQKLFLRAFSHWPLAIGFLSLRRSGAIVTISLPFFR
jgi:hypothetical protein